MPFRLRRSTISLEGSTSWLWPFGIFLRSLKSCWHNDTSVAVNLSTCAHPRSASSGTLDSRKICTTVLFVCSRTHIWNLLEHWRVIKLHGYTLAEVSQTESFCANSSPLILTEVTTRRLPINPSCQPLKTRWWKIHQPISPFSSHFPADFRDFSLPTSSQLLSTVASQGLAAGLPGLACAWTQRWCALRSLELWAIGRYLRYQSTIRIQKQRLVTIILLLLNDFLQCCKILVLLLWFK